MNRTLAALVASLFAAPALAQQAPADPPMWIGGSVGIGGLHNDNDSPDASKLNEYRDLGNGLLSTIDIKGRGTRQWFDLFGENYGRDDDYTNFRGGRYDTYRYRVYSDAMRHNFLFNGITPYDGAGTTNLRTTFPRLDPTKWFGLDEGYRRRDSGFMIEFQRATPWYARIDANQVTFNGTKPGAASQGTSPGNGFVELAIPVDYTTRNATAEAGYNSRTLHADLSYLVSKFDNGNDSVSWTNGYFGNGIDRTYLPADNRYQRLMGNFSYRQLPWGTTFAARFTLDEVKSATELGTSVLSGTAGQTSPTNPSQSTFNGRVDNTTFTASATSTPTKGLDTHVYYNYRKRDDKSDDVTFAVAGAEHVKFNYDKNNFGIDAYYRWNRGNRFGAGFDYLDTKREGRDDYDRTKDRRFFAEWKNSSLDDLAARLKYTRLDRDSNFLEGNAGTGSTDPAYWNRYVTAFDLADVKQDSWKLTLDYMLWERLDLGLEAIYKKNDYTQNTLGRLQDTRQELYFNAAYAFSPSARASFFYDTESIKYDSRHRIVGNSALGGAYEPAFAPNASNYNWTGKIHDKNYAWGGAFDWVVGPRFTLKASAIYYRTDGSVDLSLQEGVPTSVTAPAPIFTWDDSKRTSVTLKGVWLADKSWTVTGGFAFEKYEYSDSQYDGYRNTVPASSNQDSYLTGVYARPNYKANIIYGVVSYRF